MEQAVNIIIQYVLVGVVFIGALAWTVVKIRRLHRHKGNACCGCSLSEACQKKPLVEKSRNKRSPNDTNKACCHENNQNLE